MYTGLSDMTLSIQGSGETATEGGLLPTSTVGTDVTGSETPTPAGGISAWLQANSGAVYLGAGALFLMALFGGRRR